MFLKSLIVPKKGLEPLTIQRLEPKSSVSTNSTILATKIKPKSFSTSLE